uniref:Uncharacterized protein n=1 Tax=Meloidogyne hapla TaxID=6305 RepID=A0A1I8BDW4_MELHA
MNNNKINLFIFIIFYFPLIINSFLCAFGCREFPPQQIVSSSQFRSFIMPRGVRCNEYFGCCIGNCEIDNSLTSTTDDPNTTTTNITITDTILLNNKFIQNTTLMDVEQNTTKSTIITTGGFILLTDDNNNINTTVSSVSNTSLSTLIPQSSSEIINKINQKNKIISKDSTENVEKQERSILADDISDNSSQSIEERDNDEKIEGNKNIPNILENTKQLDNKQIIPSRLLIYAVQRNSNYVEEDFEAKSVSSTDKTKSKEDKTSLENSKLRRKRGKKNKKLLDNYFSDEINKLNNPIENAQKQLQQTNSAISDVLSQQAKQINIPIPNTPNIIFTSDQGNITLQRGPGFISVETSMGQHK